MSTALVAPAAAAAGAREAARERDGKFGTQLRGEVDVELTGQVTVPDINGTPVALTPGVVDDQAEYAFTNGQCLAMAVALARRNGTGLVVRWAYSEDDPDDTWIGHVWSASDPEAAAYGDGKLVDVTGAETMDDYVNGYDFEDPYDFQTVPADAIDAVLPDLEAAMNHPQDYAVADTFVDAVIARGAVTR